MIVPKGKRVYTNLTSKKVYKPGDNCPDELCGNITKATISDNKYSKQNKDDDKAL